MDLDNKVLYKLTKIGIKNDASRYFQINESAVGQAFIHKNRLVIGDVRTSPIVNFSQNGENFLIETKNSVYTLEKLDEGV